MPCLSATLWLTQWIINYSMWQQTQHNITPDDTRKTAQHKTRQHTQDNKHNKHQGTQQTQQNTWQHNKYNTTPDNTTNITQYLTTQQMQKAPDNTTNTTHQKQHNTRRHSKQNKTPDNTTNTTQNLTTEPLRYNTVYLIQLISKCNTTQLNKCSYFSPWGYNILKLCFQKFQGFSYIFQNWVELWGSNYDK